MSDPIKSAAEPAYIVKTVWPEFGAIEIDDDRVTIVGPHGAFSSFNPDAVSAWASAVTLPTKPIR